MQVAQALAEGDTDKAYEGFTELPMVTDRFPCLHDSSSGQHH
jgi:hypothetical protein